MDALVELVKRALNDSKAFDNLQSKLNLEAGQGIFWDGKPADKPELERLMVGVEQIIVFWAGYWQCRASSISGCQCHSSESVSMAQRRQAFRCMRPLSHPRVIMMQAIMQADSELQAHVRKWAAALTNIATHIPHPAASRRAASWQWQWCSRGWPCR